MQATVWVGSQELTQGKERHIYEPMKVSYSVTYTGPYSVCLSQYPAIGQSISGQDPKLIIIRAACTELDAGAGQIDIDAEYQRAPTSLSPEVIGDAVYEDDWIELQKPIEAHPRCGILDPARLYWLNGKGSADGSTGGKRRTWDDWANLIDSNNLPSEVTQVDYDPTKSDGSTTTPSGDSIWTLAQYQSLKEAGVDSYLLFQPVLKRTTYSLRPPTDLGDLSGQITTPPEEANFTHVSNFDWLQGTDRCVKTRGIYCRTTEWQGFEPNSLTGLIYETA